METKKPYTIEELQALRTEPFQQVLELLDNEIIEYDNHRIKLQVMGKQPGTVYPNNMVVKLDFQHKLNPRVRDTAGFVNISDVSMLEQVIVDRVKQIRIKFLAGGYR